ncbi:MAG: HD domain-containing protein [Nitrospirae bacterium]|jgi:HD-GYP domain-containing protein (c-di-GMP phosphodiesterase class II)|nr:HD domain-containing protein [Nitrospirota bacterium]
MSIDELRFYTRNVLPEKARDLIDNFMDTLSAISPLIYIFIILALLVVLYYTFRKLKGIHSRTTQRKELIEKLSLANTLQDYISILTEFLKKSTPGIKKIGIYIKEKTVYKLASSDIYEEGFREKDTFMEPILNEIREYERAGKYHIYSFSISSKSSAIRVISSESLNFERLKTDLAYLSALIENFIEKDNLRSNLLKTKVLKEVKDLFSAPSFNLQNYFTFIGNIILKAGNLGGVKIITGSNTIRIGNFDTKNSECRQLKVRNTDITIEICRKEGIKQEDIVNTGRFLDLISAMLSFYSNKSLIDDYIYVLETAVKVFEDSNSFYRQHSSKVEIMAKLIGEKLGLESSKLLNLRYAARLHDIGMAGDIYELALKDLKFSEKDYSILKFHPLTGASLTAPVDSLYPISNIILQHHELCDGSGYPHGIKANEMMFEAKILSFCEMFVGFISDRPHRKRYSPEMAIQEVSILVPEKIDREVFLAFMDQKETFLNELEKIT